MSDPVYFHGTDRVFERFDSARLHSHEDRHANGMLGVWAACSPDLAARFGDTVLVVRPRRNRVHEFDISDLSRLAREGALSEEGAVEHHRRFAERHRGEYDVLAIRESSGSIDMVVLLDPEEIEILARVPSAAIDRMPSILEELGLAATGTTPHP